MLPQPHFAFSWQQVPPQLDGCGVLLLQPKSGEPYLARTNVLRRRLARLSRLFDLAQLDATFSVWLTPSKLEQLLVFFAIAKHYFPTSYRKIVRLPSAPYLKVLLANAFPRTEVSTRLSGRENVLFGPFRNRSEAERFEAGLLDFFQLRRCTEDLAPHPDHPGCIYGEMNQCLRPCQLIVGPVEYQSEARRVADFLHTRGASLREAIAKARDRSSENLDFEEAARQHKRLDRLDALLAPLSEISADLRHANGVSAVKSPAGVDLYFLLNGLWQNPIALDFQSKAGESMDSRLRHVVDSLPDPQPSLKEREEHLALLHRWYFSSWRDSEWLPFAAKAELPYRKLVRLISRARNPSAKMDSNDSSPLPAPPA